MREIQVSEIIPVVEQLCISSNRQLNADVYQALQYGFAREESPTGKDILHKLLLNADMAREQGMAMCQDTGMTVIFCELVVQDFPAIVIIDSNGNNLYETEIQKYRQG